MEGSGVCTIPSRNKSAGDDEMDGWMGGWVGWPNKNKLILGRSDSSMDGQTGEQSGFSDNTARPRKKKKKKGEREGDR